MAANLRIAHTDLLFGLYYCLIISINIFWGILQNISFFFIIFRAYICICLLKIFFFKNRLDQFKNRSGLEAKADHGHTYISKNQLLCSGNPNLDISISVCRVAIYP